jgi:hypothetical protein
MGDLLSFVPNWAVMSALIVCCIFWFVILFLYCEDRLPMAYWYQQLDRVQLVAPPYEDQRQAHPRKVCTFLIWPQSPFINAPFLTVHVCLSYHYEKISQWKIVLKDYHSKDWCHNTRLILCIITTEKLIAHSFFFCGINWLHIQDADIIFYAYRYFWKAA